MAITVNGTNITAVKVNGVAMTKVIVNGVTVWGNNKSIVYTDLTGFISSSVDFGGSQYGSAISGSGTSITASWNPALVVAWTGFRTGLIDFSQYSKVRITITGMTWVSNSTTGTTFEYLFAGLSPNLSITGGTYGLYKTLNNTITLPNTNGATGTYDIDVSGVNNSQYLIFQWGSNVPNNTKSITMTITLMA